MSEPTPTAELDCRGLICPMPVLKTKKAMLNLAAGEILKVTSDDPGSVSDMVAFIRKTGHEIVDQSEASGDYIFFVRKL